MNIITFQGSDIQQLVSSVQPNVAQCSTLFPIIHETVDERNIGYKTFKNVFLTGRNLFYPNVLLYTTTQPVHELFSPYDEKIMSLNKDSFYDNNVFTEEILLSEGEHNKKIVKIPVFFFIYNFDNYYHFLYDTIPYLYVFQQLKKTIPELKILVNYPNKQKTDFYPFNLDILFKLIQSDDILLHDGNNIYETMYVSTSLTHGGFSNKPPRKELYDLYSQMKQHIVVNPFYNDYENIYVSRRTWINKDISNIGTNYTTRRKMMNEDALVSELESRGIRELFTENLTIDEKIQLFSRAKMVVGSIGGGMANLLFSPSTTKSICLVTPYFLTINYRFKFSMEHTDITYFDEVQTFTEDNDIPLYCRVKMKDGNYKDRIGEICGFNSVSGNYDIQLSSNDVAGFNNEISFESIMSNPSEFDLLDQGLNSPYVVDISKLIHLLDENI